VKAWFPVSKLFFKYVDSFLHGFCFEFGNSRVSHTTVMDTKPEFGLEANLRLRRSLSQISLASTFSETRWMVEMNLFWIQILDPDGFSRAWMIRFPPEDEFTAEMHKDDGLCVLKDFSVTNCYKLSSQHYQDC
jgi:hypothetical protein